MTKSRQMSGSFTLEVADPLARAFASASGVGQLHGHESCPSSQVIWATLTVESDSARRTAYHVVNHLAGCANCADEWRRGLQLLRDESVAEDVQASAPSTVLSNEFGDLKAVGNLVKIRFQSNRWRRAHASLLLVAAAMLTLFLKPASDRGQIVPPEEVYRGRAETAFGVRANYSFASSDATFHWPWPSEALSFELLIDGPDYAAIASISGIGGSKYTLSPALRCELSRRDAFFWQVRAIMRDGTIDVSPLHKDRIIEACARTK